MMSRTSAEPDESTTTIRTKRQDDCVRMRMNTKEKAALNSPRPAVVDLRFDRPKRACCCTRSDPYLTRSPPRVLVAPRFEPEITIERAQQASEGDVVPKPRILLSSPKMEANRFFFEIALLFFCFCCSPTHTHTRQLCNNFSTCSC